MLTNIERTSRGQVYQCERRPVVHYEYLLTGEERKLSIRAFDRRDALAAYERQNHRCAYCGEEFEFEQMQADHIVPWSKGGKTVSDNCQMLCVKCNLGKGNK